MVASQYSSLHTLEWQSDTETIPLPMSANLLDSGFSLSVGFISIRLVLLIEIKGADPEQCCHGAVCHPSLQICQKPLDSKWRASWQCVASGDWSDKSWLQATQYDAVRTLRMNADYEHQGTLPQTCTCDSIRDAREGEEVICILRRFEDKSVWRHWPHDAKTFTYMLRVGFIFERICE